MLRSLLWPNTLPPRLTLERKNLDRYATFVKAEADRPINMKSFNNKIWYYIATVIFIVQIFHLCWRTSGNSARWETKMIRIVSIVPLQYITMHYNALQCCTIRAQSWSWSEWEYSGHGAAAAWRGSLQISALRWKLIQFMCPACSRFQSWSQFIVRCHHCPFRPDSLRCGEFLICAINYFFIFTSL